MLTCKEASYLASKKLDKKLTLLEGIGFSVHIVMCRLCRHYAKDMNTLHILATKAGQSMMPDFIKLSEKSRDRIKVALDKALHQMEKNH